MFVVGIDIGTTTISAAVVNEDGRAAECMNVKNDSGFRSEYKFHDLQDPNRIISIVNNILEYISGKYRIGAIGITGQMHGILYFDRSGKAVSPLFTWQDQSGAQIYKDGMTYCQYILAKTGYIVHSGFGGCTHFFLQENGRIPQNAAGICTIGDYVSMNILGLEKPVMHISNAASIGFYDLKKGDFDFEAIGNLGMDGDFFPKPERKFKSAGALKSVINVGVAIGDNQASFLGSVKNPDEEILINIGTGGQISCYCENIEPLRYTKGIFEIRPMNEKGYLLVAASLCGGRAYAALERFFASVFEMRGEKIDSAYGYMEDVLSHYEENKDPLNVDTAFCGTRKDPDKRGSIYNISLENFTPQDLIYGVLNGMAKELYPAYKAFCKAGNFKILTASGNTVRKNKHFQSIISKVFGMPLRLTESEEEAAIGAAKAMLCGSFS